jgi:hypothetical protein
MFVCIDANGFATAWNYDGSEPSEVPQGSTLTEVTEAQFIPLRTLPRPVMFSNGQFVPATASAGDFMKALLVLGWYADVSAAVASLPDDDTGTLAKVLWARATIIERLNPLLLQIAAAIGKTSADLDDLFILANSYT